MENSEHKKHRIQPRIRIESNDPLARGILELFYDMCKEKEAIQSLSELEKEYVELVEAAYREQTIIEEEQAQKCLQQVYEILDSVQDRNANEDCIFQTLTQIITRGKDRYQPLENWFDGVKTTVTKIKKLDFSSKAPLLEQLGNSQNLPTFASVSINTIIETAKYSMLTMNVLNAISEALPDTAILVTSEDGCVKIANAFAMELLELNKYEISRYRIGDLFPDYKKYMGNDQEHSHEIFLKSPKNEKSVFSGSMQLIRTKPDKGEVTEHVYLFQQHHPMDLRLSNNININKLHYIIGSAQKLEKKFDKDTMFSDISQYAWDIKEVLQGSLSAMVQELPEEYDHVIPETVFRKVFEPLGKQLPYTELSITNEYAGAFFMVPADLELLAQLIADLCQFSKYSTSLPSRIHITISEAANIGLMILCRASDVALEDTNEKIFALLQQLVTNYHGFINIFPMGEHKAAVQICLPHAFVSKSE